MSGNAWISRVAIAALLTAFEAFGESGTPPLTLYWGDVHGHSENSDGKGSVVAYFTHARDIAGLDFVILTDHDFGNASPWRMAPDVWRAMQETADAFTVDGRFVAMAGYEWTSQPKYWTGAGVDSENLFAGPPRHFNHKNVYFPKRVDRLFSSKDPAFHTPDLLAEAVGKLGGLVHNNHPSPGIEGEDQFDYAASNAATIANTEMMPDIVRYRGTLHAVNGERTVRAFLDRGGRTGFVGATDTHEGRPAARTAVFVRALSRDGIFDALRHRRCYAVTHARIGLGFTIDGQVMGGDVETTGSPRIVVDVRGTDRIEEVTLVRDGAPLHTVRPGTKDVHFERTDESFAGGSYYYVRVVQADVDEEGNPSRAWSSPIWVRRNGAGAGPGILTPRPSAEPRINGAKVFGVRPGHPILYTIAATGRRPMKFSAAGLPPGARCDEATGRIAGAIADRGTLRIMLRAENELGHAERELRLVVGDDICLTNDEVLEINQDPLGRQGLRREVEGGEVLVKEMEDGSVAAGLFNPGPQLATVAVRWAVLGLKGPHRIRDLWRQKDLGVFDGRFEVPVRSHGVMLVRAFPK